MDTITQVLEIIAPDQEDKGVPETRRKLLAAAEALFSASGYHCVQVADITAAAGTGVGTFYRYFGEKEQILRELLQSFLANIRTRVSAIREGVEGMHPEKQIQVFRDTFELILGEFKRRPTLALIVFRTGYGISESINELIWRFVTLMTEDIIDDLERAQRALVLEVPFKKALATAIAGVTMHTAHALVVEPEMALDQAVDACMRFTIGGLSTYSTESFFNATTEVFRQLIGGGGTGKG